MIDAPGLAEVFIDLTVRHGLPRLPRLDCTARFSLHLQVLVLLVLLPSLIAVTTYASSTRTLNTNLMVA